MTLVAGVLVRYQEDVGAVEFGEHLPGVRAVKNRVAQRTRKPVEHRSPGKERHLALRQLGQDLVTHVLGDQAIMPSEPQGGRAWIGTFTE